MMHAAIRGHMIDAVEEALSLGDYDNARAVMALLEALDRKEEEI